MLFRNMSMSSSSQALEEIDFQRGPFTKELEAVLYQIADHIKEYPGSSGKDLNLCDFGKILADLIERRFGCKIKVVFNKGTAAVLLLPITSFHVFSGWMKGFYNQPEGMLNRMKGKKGGIDLENAKLTGIFTEYTHTLYLNFTDLLNNYKLTVPEIAAVMLHEVGHIFTFYEFSSRLEDANRVMIDIGNEVRGNKDQKKLTYCFHELERIMEKNKGDYDYLATEESGAILGMKMFMSVIKDVKSQMPVQNYNDTAGEALADHFSSRFGYGRELVLGLDKLAKGMGMLDVSSGWRFIYRFIEIVQIVSIFACILTAFFIPAFAGLAIFYAIVGSLAFFFSGDAHRDMTYDTQRQRYIRIRHQFISMINSVDMDKEELTGIIVAVHELDAIIEHTKDYRSIQAKVANILFSRNKEVVQSVTVQGIMEELAHNDLFLKSAELKTLS